MFLASSDKKLYWSNSCPPHPLCRWAVLDVGVNGPTSGYDDQTLLRAAGYLEGVMTNQWGHKHSPCPLSVTHVSTTPPCPSPRYRLIYYTYQNVYGLFFNKAKPEVVDKARAWYLQEVCACARSSLLCCVHLGTHWVVGLDSTGIQSVWRGLLHLCCELQHHCYPALPSLPSPLLFPCSESGWHPWLKLTLKTMLFGTMLVSSWHSLKVKRTAHVCVCEQCLCPSSPCRVLKLLCWCTVQLFSCTHLGSLLSANSLYSALNSSLLGSLIVAHHASGSPNVIQNSN